MTTNPINAIRGVKIFLRVGDGMSPETFGAFCSINAERSFKLTAATGDTPGIDCDDPEAVAWALTEKTGLKVDIAGAGTLDTRDIDDFWDWSVSPDSKNCQFVIDVGAGVGGRIFEGAFHLTEFEIKGSRQGKAEVSISLTSDGAVTKANNS